MCTVTDYLKILKFCQLIRFHRVKIIIIYKSNGMSKHHVHEQMAISVLAAKLHRELIAKAITCGSVLCYRSLEKKLYPAKLSLSSFHS